MCCVSVNEYSVCIAESGMESVFLREGDSLCFCKIKSKKEILCAWLFCVRIENGHMETTRQIVFFSVVMDYQRPFFGMD